MLQVRYTLVLLCWKLVIGWRRWDGSVLNAFSPAEFHMQHVFFPKNRLFQTWDVCLSATDAVPGFSCAGPSKLMSLVGLKLSLSSVVVSPSWLRIPWLAAASQGLCGVRGQALPCPCGQGLAEAAWVLQIPIRGNFGCNFNATSPPFLSPFRQLPFFGN